MNIFKKIFDIMKEYDDLLDKINRSNIKDSNDIEDDNIIFDDMFMQYIYKNINIGKKDEENEFIINNIINNKEDSSKKFSLNNNKNNEDSIKESSKEEILDNELELIKSYIKKLYKKLILKCHPDKCGNEKMFIKCKEYYDADFLIGLLYICYLVDFDLPLLNDLIIKKIIYEIRIIQEKIIIIKRKLK